MLCIQMNIFNNNVVKMQGHVPARRFSAGSSPPRCFIVAVNIDLLYYNVFSCC